MPARSDESLHAARFLAGGDAKNLEGHPWPSNRWTPSPGSVMLAWEAPLGNGVRVKKTVVSKERFLVKWEMANMPEVSHSTANLLPQCVIYTHPHRPRHRRVPYGAIRMRREISLFKPIMQPVTK
jgi:hypothetical protein